MVAWLFMPQAMSILAPGFTDDAEQRRLAIELTRITFPYLLLITLVTLYGGMLNVMHRFASAAAASIFLNISMMATLALAAFFPTAGHAAAWGVLISGFLQYFLLAGDLARHGGLPRFAPLRLDEDVRAFFRAIGPATLGSMGTQVAMFADTIIATFLPAGALSALYYAERLYQLPIGVIGIAIGTVLLPEMSRRITAGDRCGRDGVAAPRLRIHAAVLGAVRRRVPHRARRHHARGVRARRLHQGRCGGGRRDARGLCGRPHSVRDDPQRGLGLLRPQGYRDAGEGVADRARRQCALKILLMGSLAQVGLALATAVGAWINLLLVLGFAVRAGYLEFDRALVQSLPKFLASGVVLAAALWFGRAICCGCICAI